MRGGVKGVHALLERGWLLCDPIQPSDEAVVACRSRSAALGQMMCELGRAHERIQAVSSGGPGWAAELAPSQMGTACDTSTVDSGAHCVRPA